MIGKLTAAALLCLTSVASAEVLQVSDFDPSDPLTPIENVQGRGIKISEGTILQPVVALETGFVSNVFYEEEATPAGVMRLLVQLGTASLSKDRLNPVAPNTEPSGDGNDAVNLGSFQYQFNIRAAYQQPLSSEDVVQDTGGLALGGLFKGMANPMGTVSFGFDESFRRIIREANFETSSNENRIVNTLRLMLVYHPQGRALHGFLYYDNHVDVFESDDSDQLYPDRMTHRVGLRPTWQWLPKTQIYGDFSIGYTTGFGDAPASQAKVDSYPLNLRVGTSTLLSAKTAVNAAVGYVNGFYSGGTANYSAPFADVGVTYRYSPLARIGARYGYLHQDSVNANFFRDHLVAAWISQQVDPVEFLIQPELRLRHYEGITLMGAPDTRDDVIVQVIAGVHYNFRNWISAALEYKFSTVQTDFDYMDAGGNTIELDYLRHEIVAGLRVAM